MQQQHLGRQLGGRVILAARGRATSALPASACMPATRAPHRCMHPCRPSHAPSALPGRWYCTYDSSNLGSGCGPVVSILRQVRFARLKRGQGGARNCVARTLDLRWQRGSGWGDSIWQRSGARLQRHALHSRPVLHMRHDLPKSPHLAHWVCGMRAGAAGCKKGSRNGVKRVAGGQGSSIAPAACSLRPLHPPPANTRHNRQGLDSDAPKMTSSPRNRAAA